MNNIKYKKVGDNGIMATYTPTGLRTVSTTQETTDLNKKEATDKLNDLLEVATVQTDIFNEFGTGTN